MAGNSEAFTTAADKVKKLKAKPSDDELKLIYGLYKQAVVGDINIDSPGALDLKGKAKWDAWNAEKGKDKSTAETDYIKAVDDLASKYGLV